MAKFSPLMVVPPLVFGAFVALAAVGMFRDDPDSLPTALAGKPAPAVEVEEFPNKPVFDDASLRDGEVKLLNFWASWCAPCRVEHPNLEKLAKSGIPIYGVNYKDKIPNAAGFLQELGDPYVAHGRDDSGRMGLNWGVYGVPETYVIDGEGTIIYRFAGPITQRVIEEKIMPAIEDARN
jgi:cytochrome c biogenesis protein CcmG/thiol:disulfide interchange protein DsbE